MKADPKVDAAPKSSKKKVLVIAVMALLVLGLGGGAGWYFTHNDSADGKPKKVKTGPPVYIPIDQFTVNLQPEEGEQYLQIQFTLQVPDLQQVELIKANLPIVRNRVLLLLSGKKPSEISTPDGKRQLSREIIATLKQPFVDKGEPQQVTDVLYTSFIIQ